MPRTGPAYPPSLTFPGSCHPATLWPIHSNFLRAPHTRQCPSPPASRPLTQDAPPLCPHRCCVSPSGLCVYSMSSCRFCHPHPVSPARCPPRTCLPHKSLASKVQVTLLLFNLDAGPSLPWHNPSALLLTSANTFFGYT